MCVTSQGGIKGVGIIKVSNRPQDTEITMENLSVPKVITRVLISEEGGEMLESVILRCYISEFEDG